MANKVGLTDAKIAGLKAPTAGQIELADGIVPGLRLRMGASGIKTYILRKRVQGKWSVSYTHLTLPTSDLV